MERKKRGKYKPRKLQEGNIKTILDIATESNGHIYIDTCREICNGNEQVMYNTISRIKKKGYGEKQNNKGIKYLNIKPAGFRAEQKPTPISRNKNDIAEIIRDCKIAQTKYNAYLLGINCISKKEDEAMRSSRMHGFLINKENLFMMYNFGSYNLAFNHNVEGNTKRMLSSIHSVDEANIYAIVYVNEYIMCDKFFANQKKQNIRSNGGDRSKVNLLVPKTNFRGIYIVLNGKAGVEQMNYILGKNEAYETKVKEIIHKNSIDTQTGRTGDGQTKAGENVYNMLSMDLWKLYVLAKDDSSKVIICTEAQAEYLQTITTGTFYIV